MREELAAARLLPPYRIAVCGEVDGGDVQVGVPRPGDPTVWASRPLREVTPFYWRKALEPF